jgi:hypothetical protein
LCEDSCEAGHPKHCQTLFTVTFLVTLDVLPVASLAVIVIVTSSRNGASLVTVGESNGPKVVEYVPPLRPIGAVIGVPPIVHAAVTDVTPTSSVTIAETVDSRGFAGGHDKDCVSFSQITLGSADGCLIVGGVVSGGTVIVGGVVSGGTVIVGEVVSGGGSVVDELVVVSATELDVVSGADVVVVSGAELVVVSPIAVTVPSNWGQSRTGNPEMSVSRSTSAAFTHTVRSGDARSRTWTQSDDSVRATA